MKKQVIISVFIFLLFFVFVGCNPVMCVLKGLGLFAVAVIGTMILTALFNIFGFVFGIMISITFIADSCQSREIKNDCGFCKGGVCEQKYELDQRLDYEREMEKKFQNLYLS